MRDTDSLSLLIKIQADGVGCSSGHERGWEVSRERERQVLARARVQVTEHDWLTRARDKSKSSKILPPWFVSRTNIDSSGHLKIAVINVIAFFKNYE
jgi:hypothetical protein